MLPLLTVAQMREIDRRAIGGDAAVGYGYMLKAGMGLVDAVRAHAPSPSNHSIAVVCGKGNNGGDGYVAGAMLMDAGYRVMVFGLYYREELSGEAVMAFDEYASRRGTLMHVTDAEELGRLSSFDVVVDAVLGTGIQGPPRGLAASAIEAINSAGRPVVSADTPSGLDNDTGTPGPSCVRAAMTVTMGFPKLGACFYPGRELTGTLVVKDLGYPEDVVEQCHGRVHLPVREDMGRMLPPRKPAGSKYGHGLVLSLAGSAGMLGAATLVSAGALRSGCGMVHAAVPEGLLEALSMKMTEPVLHAVPQTETGSIAEDALERLLDMSTRMQCAVVGPGLSRHQSTAALVRAFVKQCPCPVVLDADGLNAWRECPERLAEHAAPLLLTPHAGEWNRLFGPMPSEPAGIVEQLRVRARACSAVVLFKGSPTIVAVPQGDVFVVTAGTSALATAGSGDVLAGVIAALVAQGAALTDAAVLGAWLHGRAGAIAAETRTEYGVVASDVAVTIPSAISELVTPRRAPLPREPAL